MGYHRGCGLLLLGVAAYALYKTGTLNSITKTAVNAGVKISDWSSEQLTKVKENSSCSETISAEAATIETAE